MMTEAEISQTLGLTFEPLKNKVKKDPLIVAEIIYLQSIFEISKKQTWDIGRIGTNLLVPFISDN